MSPSFCDYQYLIPPLQSDLIDPTAPVQDVSTSVEIGIKDADFTWDRDDVGTIAQRFKLSIKGEVIFHPGKINLIIGQSGSGKTSMLMALLGEMHYHALSPSSFVNLPRSDGVAYHAQESWILNETIRVCFTSHEFWISLTTVS